MTPLNRRQGHRLSQDSRARGAPTREEFDVLLSRLREVCDAQQQSLPREIDVAAFNVWSKAPFQLLCVREALIWRVNEQARFALSALERREVAAAALLARAVAEGTALIWKLRDLLMRHDKLSAKELNDLLLRAFAGARKDDDFPKSFHVMDLLREMEAIVPGYMAAYDQLSELSHPNGQGVFGLYGTVDPQKYLAIFGVDPERALFTAARITNALLGALELFNYAYNSISDLLPPYLDQLTKIWPEQGQQPTD